MPAKKKLKPRKCRVCKQEYSPWNSTQAVCSAKCAYEDTEVKRLAREKKEKLQVKRERIAAKNKFRDNDRAYQLKLAQTQFNKWIRWRDRDLPCISCCKPPKQGQRHAGHYKSRGSNSALRFDEDNCHAQCSVCNNHLSGNIGGYIDGLVSKIGIKRLESLNNHERVRKWTLEEIVDIRDEYKKRNKEAVK